MTKSLQDKVIIVTGAGRGIGREIALLCAAEGAKVVVNDPGGAADGAGSNAAPAEEVVEEIKKRGGTAVANFESVAEAIPASKIVKTATDHFGRLDGVVNNAGILRDMIFHKMSVEAFEAVIKVHLMGSFYVSHAAARIFREPLATSSPTVIAVPGSELPALVRNQPAIHQPCQMCLSSGERWTRGVPLAGDGGGYFLTSQLGQRRRDRR